MKSFWKNVSRTARQNLGTYLGASCIIALGIFIYIAMMDTLHNLGGHRGRGGFEGRLCGESHIYPVSGGG